jgi:PBSX family phage terminase large subunit
MDMTKKQIEGYDILNSGLYKDVSFYGSGRSGKTFLSTYFIFERALKYPGSFHLFLRSTYTSLLAGVFSQTIPNVLNALKIHPGIDLVELKFCHLRQNPAEVIFSNGSSIRFLGLDTVSTNKQATDKILSQEYLTADFEEANEIPFEVVEKVKTRLAQKMEGVFPISIFTLNPTTFDSWDYQYFIDKINPKSKESINNPDQVTSLFFHVNDNLNNISSDYVETLNNLSPMQKRRFLEGTYGDNFEGEIFKDIYWEKLPDINEFEKIIVYTDPSFKSSVKNDYKATVAIGLRNGAFWIIWAEAMQCTTSQMILNNYNIAIRLLSLGWEQSVDYWFENAGMPDDFEEAIQNHAEKSSWVCPYRLDSRQKGDKYSRIEGCLVPLNDQGKLFFNIDMKQERIGSLISQQFGNFRYKMGPEEHDDIPDAVHGGVSLINQPTLKPGGVKIISRPKITF